ncbi:Uu.00g087670.m01.CDS01 [Anthostomella pinea]|uniref:Uu.00g087670.m01.CDS01 n=1 Tax=Anthostomella pinea TaxID=933095 RepID=A0AAI8VMB0_9PEZI|nr:Uu.00g087670.m01.CDS01 [Anthostomella pinea]
MDWPLEDTEWTSRDLNVFNYQQGRAVILQKPSSDEMIVGELKNKNDWEVWFDNAPSVTSAEEGLYALLCSRAQPVFDGEAAPVSYLPVTRDTWERVTREFQIHRRITRTISRQVPFVSSNWERDVETAKWKISFTARTSAYLQNDLALSVTYKPSTGSIFCVVYGCNEQQIEAFMKRVRMAGDRVKYPLLMLGIFAEVERERLVGIADQLLDRFTLRSEHLENRPLDPSTDMNGANTQEHLALCLQSRSLVDHIQSVKRQLSKLLTEIDDLGQRLTLRKEKDGILPKTFKNGRQLKRMGVQMKKRLQDIIHEYDDKIDECNMIVGNTSLAMQTVWNLIARHDSQINTRFARANTMIAVETKRESSQMKSIAILTMIYLPLSSVAAIFSMDLFNWNAGAGESIVSKHIWIFAVFSVGLTTLTLLAWRHVTNRHEKTTGKGNESLGSPKTEAEMV